MALSYAQQQGQEGARKAFAMSTRQRAPPSGVRVVLDEKGQKGAWGRVYR